MKILDRFLSASGVEVTLSEFLTPFGRSYFQVETLKPNEMFGDIEHLLTFENAFDTFFDIVEHLR